VLLLLFIISVVVIFVVVVDIQMLYDVTTLLRCVEFFWLKYRKESASISWFTLVLPGDFQDNTLS
jgi:hypothetical protein